MSLGYLRNQNGSALPFFGVALLGIFGVVGMTLALSFDRGTASRLQSSADSAAIGGATAFIAELPGSAQDHLDRARDTATRLAEANLDAKAATIDVGAVTTDEYGQSTQIDVALEFRPANVFNRFNNREENSPVIRRARAVATRDFPLCVLALAETGIGLDMSKKGVLTAPDCAIWSNSKASNSMIFATKTQVTASSICAVGNVSGGTGGLVSPNPSSKCQVIPDPMKDWKPPAFGGCTSVGGLTLSGKKGLTLDVDPGVYCGGLWLKADKVELKPGLYVIKDGPLVIDSQDSFSGTGVTILLSGLDAVIEVSGHGELMLIAPSTGPLAGLAIVEDRTTTALLKGDLLGSPVSEVSGHGKIYVEGAVYLPNQTFKLSGKGMGQQASPYLQIVANRVVIDDKGELQIDFKPGQTSVPVVIPPAREAYLVN